MGNLASFGVINQRVEKIFNEEAPENKGMAFIIMCLRTLLKINNDEIEETITDGPMDGEVDAIYISNRVIHLMTFKYTDNFELSKRNYPESELDQFILTIDAIISGNLDKKTINTAIWDKYQEITELASTGRIEFKIYVISNKEYPVEQAKRKLENAIYKYKIIENPMYFNQDDLVEKIIENRIEKIDGQFHFIEKQHFEKSNGNIRTVIGAVAASDLIELIKDKKDNSKINEFVFNENVRVYKPSHSVNKAIIDSANESENYQFFYLNNGITILCDEIIYTPNTRSPIVEIKKFQIINGGQTSHSLFEVYKSSPEKFDSIELLIRVCEARSSDPVSQKISGTSNNQIPIGSRDLHSNDSIQKKLEEEFETLGYFYERKPNQHVSQPRDKVIENEVLGQLFMAYYLDLPSDAKNNKSRVFSDLYDTIFNEDSVNASKFLLLYSFYTPILDRKRIIQNKKRRKEEIEEKEAFISRATFHILNGMKYLFAHEESVIDNEAISLSEKQRKKSLMFQLKSSEITEQAISIIFQLVEEEMSIRGDLYTHDKFFKESTTNVLLRSHFQKYLASI